MQGTQWNFLVMMEVKKHIAIVAVVVVVGVTKILMFQMSMNNNK